MRPVLYEIKRSFTSKFVILMLVAIIGLSALLSYESSASLTVSNVSSSTKVAAGYFLQGGELHVVTYAYSSTGSALSGVDVSVSYNSQSESSFSDAQGFANFTFIYQKSFQLQIVNYNYSYSSYGMMSGGASAFSVSPEISFSGFDVYQFLRSPANSSDLGFLLFYVGKNGSLSPPIKVYVAKISKNSFPLNNTMVKDNATYIYSVSSFVAYPIFPKLTQKNYNKTFAAAFEIGNSSFTLNSPLFLGRLSTYQPITQSEIQSIVLREIGSILNIFIPLLAIFAGYLTYGRDKTSGVLESVLKRPVTKGELITSRFFANSASLVFAVTVSVAISDILIHYYLHSYLTSYFTLYFIWTYVVEGVAFLGLSYLITHLVKSPGALLGSSITIFLVMSLFWSIITFTIMLAVGMVPGNPSYATLSIVFDILSPSGFQNLVAFYFTHSLGLFSTTVNPSTYWITGSTLIIIGALWMAVPLFIAVYRAIRYD